MPEQGNPTPIGRRTFMKGAGLSGALLVVASHVPKGWAAALSPVTPNPPRSLAKPANPKRQIVQQILSEASRSKNMPAAIDRYGAALSPQDKNTLLGFTQADLAALESIYSKLMCCDTVRR
jgi:hypothetical protein